METVELRVTCPESNETYSFMLNEQDANRAEQDMVFVQTLLEKAQAPNNPNTIEKEDDSVYATRFHFTEEYKGQKKAWGYNETSELICSVETHYDMMHHPQKRKQIWEHVANDLLSKNICFTAADCYKKWQNLLRSYRVAKDNKKKTGTGPSRFNFFLKMDDILGCQPSNSSPHSIDVQTLIKATDKSLEDAHVNISCNELEQESNIEKKTKSPAGGKKRKSNLTADLLKVKKRCLELKEESKEEKKRFIEKKLELEERKVAALEKFIEIKEKMLSK